MGSPPQSLGKQAVACPGLREYVDEAESGRVMNRPEFRRMIDEARKTKAPFNEILAAGVGFFPLNAPHSWPRTLTGRT